MKRNEVVKQSKKLLSAVIAASVIASSAVPETLLAADFSDAETAELDVEDTGADEQNVEVEGEQEPDSDAEVDVEGDDNEEEEIASGDEGIDSFDFSDGTNADKKAATAGTESDAVKELQNRINALPTVEEFKVMADGTTVEESTLNQKQMDVYNETQDIADEMDKLTGEELEQLDTGKLETLCEYFNNQTEETADYTIGENDGFTVEENKSLTATFSVTRNDLNMKGWLLCFFKDKPEVDKRTNKLIQSGSTHPYTYKECKYYFYASSETQEGQITASWSKDSIDVKGSGKKLADVIDEKGCANLYIVIGPRYYADWSNPGTEFGTGKDNIYENCDYYVGRAGDVISSAWHKHSWEYKKDKDSKVIKASCKQELGSEYCKYYNKEVLELGFDKENSYVYNKKPVSHIQDNVTSVTKDSAEIKYEGRDGTDYTSTINAPTNVGKYTVTVTLGGQTITDDFEITKKKIEKPNASTYPIEYNGDSQYCVDKDADGWYKVSGAENDNCINAGFHIAKVSLTDSNNTEWTDGTTEDVEYKFEIVQATPYVWVGFESYSENYEWKYGQIDELPRLRVYSWPQDGSAELRYYYKEKNKDDSTYQPIEEDNIYKLQAGEYTLQVVVGETANCKAGSGTCNFTIKKGVMATKPSIANTGWEENWKYGDEPKTPALTEESNPEKGTVTYLYYTNEECTEVTTESDGASEPGAQPTYAGKYWVKAIISGMINYEDAETEPISFTIEKASMKAPDVTVVNETYKGQKGQLTGVSSEMEYRKASEESYTEIEGNSVTGLEPGIYYVRYRQNRNHDVSEEKEVKIAEGKNLELHLPEAGAQTGYTLNLVKSNTDSWPGSATFEVKLKEGYSKTEKFAVEINGKSVEPDEDGTYTVELHEDANVTVTGVADITAPTGSICIGESVSKDFAENITFDQYFNNKLNVELTAQDAGSGIQNISYYLADKAMTKDEVAALSNEKWTNYAKAFSLDSDGMYVVYVKLTDKDGNVKYLSSNGMVIDSLPANVAGVDSNKTYTKSTTVTVTDANLDKVVVNGKEVVLGQNGTFVLTPNSEKYYIEVSDKAGNITKIDNVKVDWENVAIPDAGSKIYTGNGLKSEVTDTAVYKVIENKEVVNVGVYDVILKLTDTVNYKWNDEAVGKAEKVIKFNITKATPKVTAPTAINLIYNGEVQTLVDGGTTTFGTLEYSLDAKNWSENVPEAKNAGNYDIYYRVIGNNNFESVESKSVTVTVAPKAVTVTADDATKVYGSEDGSFTYKAEGVADGDKLTDITVSRKAGEAAGTYEIMASQKEGANPNYSITFKNGTFTITKAAAVAATKEPEVKANVTYTGSDQPLVTAGEVTVGTLVYQVNGGEWSDQIPTVKDAGTYKISYKIKGDGNHEDSAVKELTVTVAPKAVTVTADNATKVYGSKDGSFTYKADGVADGDKLTDITVSRKAGEDVGTYEITASQKEGANPNYSITFKTGTFTITKAAAAAAPVKKPEVKANATYTGSDQPLVTAGEVKDGTLMYRVNDGEWTDQIPTVKNAGTYKVGYKVVGAKNYNDSEEETLNVTVAPKAVTVTADDATKVYGSEDGSFTYKAEGVADGDKLTDITVSRKAGEAAGTYEIMASQKEGANPNYSITFKNGTFTITKAAAVAATKEPEVKANVTYTGSDQPLVTAGEVTVGTLVYQVNGGEWSDQIPTVKDAGTYKISYKIKGDGNHEDSAVKELTVTVAPKAVTVTADDAKKYSGKADPKLTYKVSGLVGNDKLSDIVISRKAGENVGSYAITVSQKQGANPNYTITFKNAVFTITQGDQSRLNGNAVAKLRLPILLARGNGAKSAVNLKWLKYSGATGYEVYWSYCDGKQNYKKLATVANGKLTATHKKLKKNREYKYFVAAYKMVDGNKVYIAKSNSLHVAMKQANKTNAKSVSVKKQNVVLSQGRTFQIKASVKLENKKKKQLSHAARFRYYVVNSKVATVSKSGKIKAVGKGTTYIYVLANNGAFKTVKVTVK